MSGGANVWDLIFIIAREVNETMLLQQQKATSNRLYCIYIRVCFALYYVW